MHPLPLSEVQALRKAVPSFGTHHVVVVLGNGLTLPPLFFGQGGVRAMFSALKQVEPLGCCLQFACCCFRPGATLHALGSPVARE